MYAMTTIETEDRLDAFWRELRDFISEHAPDVAFRGRPAAEDRIVRQQLARFATRLRPIVVMAQATVERRRHCEVRPPDPVSTISAGWMTLFR